MYTHGNAVGMDRTCAGQSLTALVGGKTLFEVYDMGRIEFETRCRKISWGLIDPHMSFA